MHPAERKQSASDTAEQASPRALHRPLIGQSFAQVACEEGCSGTIREELGAEGGEDGASCLRLSVQPEAIRSARNAREGRGMVGERRD